MKKYNYLIISLWALLLTGCGYNTFQTTDENAKKAMQKLKDLAGCEVHMTHMPTPGDEAGLRKLGVNLTSDPDYVTKALFVT